jgi:hypothetical protein
VNIRQAAGAADEGLMSDALHRALNLCGTAYFFATSIQRADAMLSLVELASAPSHRLDALPNPLCPRGWHGTGYGGMKAKPPVRLMADGFAVCKAAPGVHPGKADRSKYRQADGAAVA